VSKKNFFSVKIKQKVGLSKKLCEQLTIVHGIELDIEIGFLIDFLTLSRSDSGSTHDIY